MTESMDSQTIANQPSAAAGTIQIQGARALLCLRILAAVCVFSFGPWHEAIRTTSLMNSDVWMHLRTGEWMLQNHALPRAALFTRHSELPWIVPSWGFDLFLGVLAKGFGLRAIPLLFMAFKAALAVLTFLLLRGWRGQFWKAIVLTALVQYILLAFPPLPAMFSALFLIVELFLLMECRRSGNVRLLWWLPLLFVCWANVDVQFVDGLLVLGLFLLASLIEAGIPKQGSTFANAALPLRSVFLVSGLSAGATLVTPYFYGPYLTLLGDPVGKIGRQVLDSLHSMNFREPQHYAVLLLTMAAFFALGRRPWDCFQILLIAVCAAFAFRWQQNLWFITLPGVAIISGGFGAASQSSMRKGDTPRFELISTGALAAVLFVLAAARVPAPGMLLSGISGEFPVQAANYIREHHLARPLYNAQAWGGFLAWYLPEYPVSIDGRIEMYGQDLNERFFEISTGTRSPEEDAMFRESRIFLLKRDSRLYDTLTHLPGLQIAYEDNLAVVMERQLAIPAPAH